MASGAAAGGGGSALLRHQYGTGATGGIAGIGSQARRKKVRMCLCAYFFFFSSVSFPKETCRTNDRLFFSTFTSHCC